MNAANCTSAQGSVSPSASPSRVLQMANPRRTEEDGNDPKRVKVNSPESQLAAKEAQLAAKEAQLAAKEAKLAAKEARGSISPSASPSQVLQMANLRRIEEDGNDPKQAQLAAMRAVQMKKAQEYLKGSFRFGKFDPWHNSKFVGIEEAKVEKDFDLLKELNLRYEIPLAKHQIDRTTFRKEWSAIHNAIYPPRKINTAKAKTIIMAKEMDD